MRKKAKGFQVVLRLAATLSFTIVLLLFSCQEKKAEGTLRVAVASNFASCAQALAEDFHKRTGGDVVLSFASTGKHYTQIVHGAPFDVFLAADKKHPKLLEAQGRAKKKVFVYARGSLVLLTDKTLSEGKTCEEYIHLLMKGKVKIALAQTELAPYGRAAKEYLKSKNLWGLGHESWVFAENQSQVYSFWQAKVVSAAFLSLSQVQDLEKSHYYLLPKENYEAIEQAAIFLRKTQLSDSFYNYLQSSGAKQIISSFKYDVD